MNHEDGDQYTSRIITTPGYVYGLWTDERDSGSRHYLVANGSGWGDGVGVGNYDNGTWRMVTLVASSESNSSNTNRNYRIYINGEEVTSNTSPNDYNYKFSNNSDQRLFLGSEVGGQNNFFKGKLDDIRIYSGALSADQIKVLYDKESEGSDLSTIVVPAHGISI